MTYSKCPYELPIAHWVSGRFCKLGDRCSWPNCTRTDPDSTSRAKGAIAFRQSFDSSHSEQVSANSTPIKGAFFESQDKNIKKLSDSSHSAKVWQRTSIYESKGQQYYRYQWGRGSRVMETIHIPGGNVCSQLATNRAFAVYKAVYWEGKTVDQVKDIISPWRGHRAKL